MKTFKQDVKRYILKWTNPCFERDGHLPNALKNRPLRKNDEDKIYKVHHCTSIELDYLDLNNLLTNGNKFLKNSHYISDYTLIRFIREYFKDDNIGFFDMSYCYGHINTSRCEEICLTKQGTISVNVIIFKEDAELITKYTPKEAKMAEERRKREATQRLYEAIILPTLESALSEFGVRVDEAGVYVCGEDGLTNFLKTSIKKLVIPRLEQLGLDTEPLFKALDNTTDYNAYMKRFFRPTDFKLKGDK